MFAYTKPDAGPEAWEPLTGHLAEVARRASGFAEAFGATGLGRAAGLWHDLGKASAAFQWDVLGAGADEADTDAADNL